MWQILQNNWNNNRAYIIKLIYINVRIYMLTIIQKLFNLTVSHTYVYISPFWCMKNSNGMCMLSSCSSTRKWFEKRVKIWNLQVAKIRSLDMCVPCAPADAFFHHLPLEIDAKLILLTTEKWNLKEGCAIAKKKERMCDGNASSCNMAYCGFLRTPYLQSWRWYACIFHHSVHHHIFSHRFWIPGRIILYIIM